MQERHNQSERPPLNGHTTKRVGVLIVEWIAVFTIVRLVRVFVHLRHSTATQIRGRLRAAATRMAHSFDEACTILLRQISAVRNLRYFRVRRRRSPSALRPSRSLGSLAELLGSDELELRSSESRSFSRTSDSYCSKSTSTSYYTISDSEANYVEADSEATTVPRGSISDALRKRVLKEDDYSNSAVASVSSLCVLTSSEPPTAVADTAAEGSGTLEDSYHDSSYYESSEESSSSYTSDCSSGGHMSSASMVSTLLKYLVKIKSSRKVAAGRAPTGERRRRCSPPGGQGSRKFERPLHYQAGTAPTGERRRKCSPPDGQDSRKFELPLHYRDGRHVFSGRNGFTRGHLVQSERSENLMRGVKGLKTSRPRRGNHMMI